MIMSEEDEEGFKNIDVCQFCEKNFISDKVRDQCHLTGKYGDPTHSKSNYNVTQKQSQSIPFKFHNFSKYDCHMFLMK